jgi:hypothetical protein
MFTKLDLAKYQLTCEMFPYIVSRGGQKVLVHFMQKEPMDSHRQREGEPDTAYFERLIARALLFRTTDRLVKQDRITFPAYQANIITYAIARLIHETGGRLDLGRIWREQGISQDLQIALLDLARSVQRFITTENRGGNVTEFCKKPVAWEHYLKEDVYTDGGFERFKGASTTALRSTPGKRLGASAAQTYAAQELIHRVISTPSTIWFAIAEWGRATGVLNALQCTISTEVAIQVANKCPINTKQADLADKILSAARDGGCPALSVPSSP